MGSLGRTFTLATLALILYAAAVAAYFWSHAAGEVPPALAGTPADPEVFMTEEEFGRMERYSAFRYMYSFFMPGWQVYVLYLLWIAKFPERTERRLFGGLPGRRWKMPAALLITYLVCRLALFPFQFMFYRVKTAFGLSRQPALSWINDYATGLAAGIFTEFIAFLALWWIARRFRRTGWAAAGVLAVAAVALYVYLEPVVIDPLYNRFASLEEGPLKAQILKLSADAGVPAEDVYVTNASKQTTSINAYVKGIGATSRIVLWDNALNKLEDDEILSLVAHEIVHYRDRHVVLGSMLAAAGAFPFCLLWFTMYRWAEHRAERRARLTAEGQRPEEPADKQAEKPAHMLTTTAAIPEMQAKEGEPAGARRFAEARQRGQSRRKPAGTQAERAGGRLNGFPLFMLAGVLLLFLVNPVVNLISVQMETAADRGALELYPNAEASLGLHRKLAVHNLSNPVPPGIVQLFFGTHPPLIERMAADLAFGADAAAGSR